jgi:hypothetical protein
MCLQSASANPFVTSAGKSTLQIDQELVESTVIPLGENKPIYSFSISGHGYIDGANTLIRVVLVDKEEREYLVYEGYSLLERGNSGLFPFAKQCEETCILNGIVPSQLKILISRGAVSIRQAHVSYSPKDLPQEAQQKGLTSFAQQLKRSQDASKVERINSTPGILWRAGENEFSGKSYQARKELAGHDFGAPTGFEFYRSGFFLAPTLDFSAPTLVGSGRKGGGGTSPTPAPTATPAAAPTPPTTDLVSYPIGGTVSKPLETVDWTNRHGVRWTTGIRNQAWCGSCWAFGAVATIETNTNLWFNQLLNYDLSEQQTLSCSGAGTCKGGWPGSAASWHATNGLIAETCMPYRAIDANGCDYDSCEFVPVTCGSGCATSPITVKFAGISNVDSSADSIKMAILERGTLSGTVWGWSHAMELVGYGVIKAGDFIYADTNYNTRISVLTGDARIGSTWWKFKNSWGNWGEGGYARIYYASGYPGAQAIVGPVTVSGATLSISCNDNDNDTFCNWGTSKTKPSTCPASCSGNNVPDCDDSNAAVGACQFQQVALDYRLECRQYDSSLTHCPASGASCPAGTIAYPTKSICGSTGRKANQASYWTHCAKQIYSCGTCPSGSVLASHSACANAGSVCSAGSCT